MIWHEATFIGQKALSPTTRKFWFKLNSEVPIEYQAGQFFTFDLPTGSKRLDRWRSYSVANVFDGSNLIELCISYKKDGPASEYFFETINKGDVVKCKGPDGAFVLPADTNQSLVLICTGTGIVPFRAMMQHIVQNGIQFPSIHLVFGTRRQKDIIYLEDMEDWAGYIPNFKVSICLSREQKLPDATPKLNYFQGYIHQAYLNDSQHNNKSLYLICGWNNIIDEVVLNLVQKLKIERKQIRFELFG
ncbi:MAG: FAD-dependent oxidoreductase [Saprospiraceae bacterium]|nr:FAD-dependent oxidoreductase [Saprospiraceae bacterium]